MNNMEINEIIKKIENDIIGIKEYLDKALLILDHDPASSINNIGKAIEKILKDVYQKETNFTAKKNDMTIYEFISLIPEGILKKDLRIEIDYIQRYRNISSHHNEVKIPASTPVRCLHSFNIIYEWYNANYNIIDSRVDSNTSFSKDEAIKQNSELTKEIASIESVNNESSFYVEEVYQDIIRKKIILNDYIGKKIDLVENESPSVYQTIIENYQNMSKSFFKPVVAVVGPSDSGKSTLINNLLGINILPTSWTPTTSTAIFIMHMSDKPEWMTTDSVWVFGNNSSNDSIINFRMINNQNYCNRRLIKSGNRDLLDLYTTRNYNNKNVDSVFIFLNSPVLNGCIMMDLPGFGTEDQDETLKAHSAIKIADVIMFTCQSNSFFNKADDIIFIKNIIYHLPLYKNSILDNLYIIATQANIVGDMELTRIYQRGHRVIINDMVDELVVQHYAIDKDVFSGLLEGRFFSYEIDNKVLKEKFELDFYNLLTKKLPEVFIKNAEQAVEDFKRKSSMMFSDEIQKYQRVFNDREECKISYQNMILHRDNLFYKIESKKEKLFSLIDDYLNADLNSFNQWFKNEITIDNIKEIIKKLYKNKNEAKEKIGSYLMDMYQAQIQELLAKSYEAFKIDLENFFETMDRDISNVLKLDVEEIIMPIDVRGGVASLVTFGALGAWAATYGSLGGYILVAKGVSLLSTIGISVGGTASVISAVAALGGPITLAIGLSFLVGGIYKFLFGESWELKIAKEMHKNIIQKKINDQYAEILIKWWRDAQLGLDEHIDRKKNEYEKNSSELKKIIDSYIPSEIEQSIRIYEELKSFFEEIPW